MRRILSGRFAPELLAGFDRNRWQVYSGINGRFEPDFANKEQRQQFEYPDSVDFESKKADVIKIIYLINMFFEDKYIYLSALSNQETQNEKNEEADHIITLGKNNIENSENSNGIKKTNENVDIESIRIIVKFYNKNLISTTKLQRLQQNNFQYEPTAQFHKSLRIQSFAIVSSLLIGIFPWVCDKCIDDTQALTIKITDKKAFEKILDRIKNENKQYQGYSRDIHSYLQEIKKLVSAKLPPSSQNKKHMLRSYLH